jgi:hypothetical protein
MQIKSMSKGPIAKGCKSASIKMGSLGHDKQKRKMALKRTLKNMSPESL